MAKVKKKLTAAQKRARKTAKAERQPINSIMVPLHPLEF